MAEQNASTEPTGDQGRTPNLAAMIRGTVFTGPSAPADPRAAPAPVQRRAPAQPRRASTNNPNMTAQRQANFAQRGLSTSQESAARARADYRSRNLAERTNRPEPQGEIIGAVFQTNEGDAPRFGYDYKFIARQTTIGTLPARPKAVKRARVQPAIEVRQFATDQFGRPRIAQTIRSITRRSVGLAR